LREPRPAPLLEGVRVNKKRKSQKRGIGNSRKTTCQPPGSRRSVMKKIQGDQGKSREGDSERVLSGRRKVSFPSKH